MKYSSTKYYYSDRQFSASFGYRALLNIKKSTDNFGPRPKKKQNFKDNELSKEDFKNNEISQWLPLETGYARLITNTKTQKIIYVVYFF